jgi:hypothetical protein
MTSRSFKRRSRPGTQFWSLHRDEQIAALTEQIKDVERQHRKYWSWKRLSLECPEAEAFFNKCLEELRTFRQQLIGEYLSDRIELGLKDHEELVDIKEYTEVDAPLPGPRLPLLTELPITYTRGMRFPSISKYEEDIAQPMYVVHVSESRSYDYSIKPAGLRPTLQRYDRVFKWDGSRLLVQGWRMLGEPRDFWMEPILDSSLLRDILTGAWLPATEEEKKRVILDAPYQPRG